MGDFIKGLANVWVHKSPFFSLPHVFCNPFLLLQMPGGGCRMTCHITSPGGADQSVILPILLPALFEDCFQVCLFQVPRTLSDGSGLSKVFDRGLSMTQASLLNLPDTKSLLNIPNLQRSAQDTTHTCPGPQGYFRREPEVISSLGPQPQWAVCADHSFPEHFYQ